MLIKKRPPKTLKNYVSKIDRKLAQFDHAHKLSPSQQAEIKKYEWIYKRRDEAIKFTTNKNIWQF